MKPENVLEKLEQQYRITEAEKSFKFIVSLRDNRNVSDSIRFAAAQDIQDRVFGKPKQSTDITSGGRSLIDILQEVHGDAGSKDA